MSSGRLWTANVSWKTRGANSVSVAAALGGPRRGGGLVMRAILHPGCNLSARCVTHSQNRLMEATMRKALTTVTLGLLVSAAALAPARATAHDRDDNDYSQKDEINMNVELSADATV